MAEPQTLQSPSPAGPSPAGPRAVAPPLAKPPATGLSASPPPAGEPPKGAAGKKQPKDKRSKEQIKADADATEARRLLDLWLKYKAFLVLAFSKNRLAPDAERQFLEVTSELQKQQRILMPFVPRDVDFGVDRMSKLLRGAITLQHLRELPEADKKKIFAEWHSIYVLVTRCAGAMHFIAEGYVHKAVIKEEMGLKGLKSGGGSAQTGIPWHKNPSAVTMLIVGVVVVFFLLYYLGKLPF